MVASLTHQCLTDIDDSLGGIRLDRPALSSTLKERLATYRLVQIRGLPGSGKSVVLRRAVACDLERGPVLLLKSGRLEGTGWAGFASAFGLSAAPLPSLLVEPPAVARVVELLSQWEFEHGSQWPRLLREVDSSQMRSQWTRSWLLAPLGASNFEHSETAYSDAVQTDEFRFLKKALVWFQAERTTPNSTILAGASPADQRIRVADLLGWPADYPTWARLIHFLLRRIDAIPVTLYPDIVTLFEVWQNALAWLKNPVSTALLELADRWLQETQREDIP